MGNPTGVASVRHGSSSVGFEVYQAINWNDRNLVLLLLFLDFAWSWWSRHFCGQYKNSRSQRANVALVDARCQHGSSYPRIGWNWLKEVLHQGLQLFCTFSLCGCVEPNLAYASKKQT